MSRKTYSDRTINDQYAKHKHSANGLKNVSREALSRSDWEKIVFNPCFYCGRLETKNVAKLPSYGVLSERKMPEDEKERYAVKMSGVDRLDPSKGYILENCVPCCTFCNKLKLHYPLEEFLKHCEKIYEHRRLNAD